MKQKIKVTGVDGKVIEGEVAVPNKEHLAVQIKYPSRIQKSKKIYSRKQKHKGDKNYD